MAILSTPSSDVYPTAGAPPLGVVGSAAEETPQSQRPTVGFTGAVTGGAAPMALGSPVTWFFMLAILTLGVAYFVQHRSPEETFKNPKVSAVAAVSVYGLWLVAHFFFRGTATLVQSKLGANGYSTFINAWG